MKTRLLLLLLMTFSFGNAQVTSGLIQEFRFDNSYMNQNSDVTFTNNANTSFVADRFGNTNGALTIQNQGIEAYFNSLPQGNSPRTVSVWVVSQSTVDNQVFNYGTNSANQAYGFSVQNASVTNYGWGNDLVLNGYSIGPNSWVHIVTTYDGTTAKIYYNGTMLASGSKAWNTSSSAFRLGRNINGSNGFYGHVDDLKIYNRALTDAEVTQLYNQQNVAVLTPIISNVSALSSANSVTITGNVNANNGATTTVVKYGLTNSNLSSQVSGQSVTGSAATPVSASITGLLANTQYFYKVEATNSAGTTSSPIGTFTTGVPIAEYTFDNTYNNVNGNTPFGYGISTSFVNDRNGITSGVLSIGALVTSPNVNITSLPQGTSERSISIWYKVASNAGYPGVFSYGTAAIKQTFGLYLGPNGNPIFQGFGAGNDIDFGGTYAANTWHHVVITLQSNGNLQLYMNGNLLNTVGLVLNTIGTNFKLISNGVITQVDDLKIYNYALSAAAVSSLHTTNSTLSNSDFSQNNLEVALYPNPVNDVLNIQTALEIQSVEIYNIQGQKVLATNQKEINVSALTSGIYLVRIQDADNNIATKKIVIQ